MLRSLVLALALITVSAPAQAGDYVGAETCKACHPAEYAQWSRTGHAVATRRLSKVQQRDRVCLSCHTTDATSSVLVSDGVECESCHGAGRHYSPRWVMKDPKLSRLLGLEKITEATCAACHRPDGPAAEPFNFASKVRRVMHADPEPSAAAPAAHEPVAER